MISAYVWTFIAAVAVVVGAFNVDDAYRDLLASEATNDDPSHRARHVLARSSLIGELFRMGTQLIFLLIGVGVLVPSLRETEMFGVLLEWGLVLAAVLVAANTVRLFVIRRKLREILAHREGEGDT